MIVECPNCHERVPAQDYDAELVHTCIGTTVVTTDSVPDITKPNWNLSGMGSKSARANIDDYNSHGDRKQTHREQKHEEYIEVK